MEIDLRKCAFEAQVGVLRAGALVMSLARTGVQEERKESKDTGGRDIVTVADLESQTFLRGGL